MQRTLSVTLRRVHVKNYGNATMGSPCIVVHLYVDVNNVKVFSAPMEVQQWAPFVCVTVNNAKGFSAAM